MKSWDFFDTLFNRKCSVTQLYSLIESKSSIPGIKDRRLQADRLLYSKDEDPNLFDIYVHMGFDSRECERLILLEESLETSLLVPNNILLGEVTSNDIILSDTHHSSRFLRLLLTKHKPELKDIRILVSNETGNRKSDGSMFDAKYTPMLSPHKGDNFHSDVKMCLRSGRIPFYNRDPNSIRQYKSFVNSSYYKVGRAYLQSDTTESALQAFIIAPLFFEWAESIIKKALNDKVEKIVFLSRDMYFIKFIVDEILNFRRLEIQTQYLYVSRKSLLCTTDIDEGEWGDEIITACSSIEGYKGRRGLINKSMQNKYLTNYLNQVLSNGLNLIVDVGWKLTSQHRLQKLVVPSKRLKGYYFGIKDVIDSDIEASAFCFDERHLNVSSCSRRACDELVNPLESLLAAPHKSVLLYDVDGPIIIPESIEKRDSVSSNLRTLIRYCKTYLYISQGSQISDGALESFLQFIDRPNRSMLMELCESLNTEFDSSKPLVSKISARDIFRLDINASLWPKGSVIISFPKLYSIYKILTS